MSAQQRILVIDDDPLFRRLVVRLLEQQFEVSDSSDGAAAFHQALKTPPDMVIVDVLMPGWDGLQTLRAFRGHPALAKIPVIVLTSDATRDTVMSAIEAGADDYLVKTSFSSKDLMQKLSRWFPCELVPGDTRRSRPGTSGDGAQPNSGTASSASTSTTTAEDTVSCETVTGSDSPDECENEAAELDRLMDDWD